MSVESWKAEFYLVDAQDRSVRSVDAALDHSLRKWEGLRKKNLEKHELVQVGTSLFEALPDGTHDEDGPELRIEGETCALCVHFSCSLSYSFKSACPLDAERGAPCDVEREDERNSPYHAWSKYGHAGPMIRWLKLTKAEYGG